MALKTEIRPDYVSVDDCDTIAKLFRARTAQWRDKVALREKNYGIWEAFTWQQFGDYSRSIAGGLIALGMIKGDVVAILSEDNKEWVFSDAAAMMAGGIVNGIYPTYQAAQLQHCLTDSDSRFLLLENEEQLDKYLAIADQLPLVKKVIVFDWKGLRGFHHDKVISLGELYDLGQQHLRSHPEEIDRRIDAGANDDTVLLVYTSGTTGKPKGAELSNRYLLFQMTFAPDPFAISDQDDLLTYLPLCHVAERVISLCIQLGHGSRINFAESPETIFQNLQELSPTVLFAVPRIWEKFYSRVTTLMSESTWAGQKAYQWAINTGTRRAEQILQGEKPRPTTELAFRLADRLVLRNLKQLLGLDRARYLLSGAAPISAELLKWFLALGLPVYEAYGQTETGIVTGMPLGKLNPGTVGKALPGVEIRLSEQDEILVRSPGMMSRYRNQPEVTAATLCQGWIHTGDVGAIDKDGNLRITDRLKDIIITAGGKNITPSQIENSLKFSPYISDAVVIGDQRKYLTCLIMIDQDNVEHFAQSRQIPYSDFKSLCGRPEVVELIDNEMRKVNLRFSSVEQIKKFCLIDVLLTAEDDELTPTMKLKRSFVNQKYQGLIETMY